MDAPLVIERLGAIIPKLRERNLALRNAARNGQFEVLSSEF